MSNIDDAHLTCPDMLMCVGHGVMSSLVDLLHLLIAEFSEFMLTFSLVRCDRLLTMKSTSGDALFAMKNDLNASADQLADWNPNQVNPCTWPKIICDSGNNVISV